MPGTCCRFVEKKETLTNYIQINWVVEKKENYKSLPQGNPADNAKVWRGSVRKSMLTGGGEITKEGPTTPPEELHPRKYRTKKMKL